MKKWYKNILSLLFAAVLLMTLPLAAFASNAYNTNGGTDPANPLSDTTKFTFTKHYTLVGAASGQSPAEDFTVTFTPYAVANTPASAGITVATMPAIATATLSAAAGAATGDITAEITLPTYSNIGDYWYQVAETAGSTAGVTYDSNQYYLHVQVVHESDSSTNLLRLVTLHTKAPNADGTPNTTGDSKNDGITNTYSNGTLAVKKVVSGNLGDKTKEYQATVEFTYTSADSANCPVKSTIQYTDGTAKTIATTDWAYASGAWKATAALTLSDNETVTFTNLPYGVAYTVTETDYSADGYTHTFAFASDDSGSDTVTAEGGTWSNAKATGTIADDADELTITNEKTSEIDVGVLVENAPFFGIFALAAAGLFVLLISKRRKMTDR